MSKWSKEHPKEAAAYAREWRKNHPEKAKANDKRNYERHKERHNAYAAEWTKSHREDNRRRANAKNAEIRKMVLRAYGDMCVCCGETEPSFLAIDHIDGGGNAHRKSVGSSSRFYRWIIKNNYPDGLQILCHNCNLAKGFYGECPHQSFRLLNLFKDMNVVVVEATK